MQNLLRLTPLALICLGTGCVIHERSQGRYQPGPTAPPPPAPVVVVAPQPTPPAPVVVITPQRTPPPAPTVIVRTPAPPRKEPLVSVTITAQEHEAICDHLNNAEREHHQGKGRGGHLPPGLAKKAARGESLPPGWQKRIVRGQTLSPEIYQHCEPVPAHVVAHLPPPPPGTILVTVEGKIVRLLQATLEILDVLDIHVATARQ